MPVYLLESATVSVLAYLDELSLKQALFYRDKALLPRIRNIHGARLKGLNRVFGGNPNLNLNRSKQLRHWQCKRVTESLRPLTG